MQRVAANQDRAMQDRSLWTYTQSILTQLRRTNGTLAREERKEYTVAPTQSGAEKKLTSFSGKYESKGQYHTYDKPGHEYKGVDIDGDLIDDLANDFVSDEKSKDGISPDLFPLNTREVAKYEFKLHGVETYREAKVYRITFTPRKGHPEAPVWSGEALVDASELQPVRIATDLARKVPFAVKTLLGTNVSNLGFTVLYQKVADGVWFPASFGGEFNLRAVFVYGRKVSISMSNSEFRRVDVQSRVLDDEP